MNRNSISDSPVGLASKRLELIALEKPAQRSRLVLAGGIVLALTAAILWPWRMADGGDAPDRSRSRKLSGRIR